VNQHATLHLLLGHFLVPWMLSIVNRVAGVKMEKYSIGELVMRENA
jgi:hypothetical protein